MEPVASRRRRSVWGAVVALVLSAWALAGFADDRRVLSRAEAFCVRYTLDRRRPLELAAMPLERTSDGATAVAVEAALEDGGGGRPPAEMSPEQQALWLQVSGGIVEELGSARELVFDAVARRPARVRHRFLLAKIAYALDAHSGGKADPLVWIQAFRLAASAAPGLDPIQTALGTAYLQNWTRLSAADKAEVGPTWRRAFLDPGFVSKALGPAASLIGPDQALALVPDRAPSLRAASDSLKASGDLERAVGLRRRLDRALRDEREQGLAAIARRLEAGNLEGARTECLDWIGRSSPSEFDDAPGRAQAARLLALWPNDTGGPWRTDPRGVLVRFFLDHREKDVPGEVLVRATDALTAVPDTVRARVRLLAGDVPAAEAIRERSSVPGSYEWVPYLVELGRGKLASGDAGGARAILKGLSASAAEGCDALLLRRDVALSLGDAEEATAVTRRLAGTLHDVIPAEAWSAGGLMSLCLDQKATGKGQIRIALQTDGPSIVAFGWNGGRQGSVFVPGGSSSLVLPVPEVSGRQTLFVAREAGSPVSLGSVGFEPRAQASDALTRSKEQV